MNVNERKQRWIDRLADPELGLQHAVMLQDVGSEFKRYATREGRRVGIATDAAEAVLIGDVAASLVTLGSRRLVVPTGLCMKVEQLNYYYREAAGGTLTEAINAAQIILKTGGKQVQELPGFRLDEFDVGDSALRFGAIPVGLWVTPERQLSVTLKPSGTAGGSFDCRVSLVLRFEPREIAQAAGLIDPWGGDHA